MKNFRPLSFFNIDSFGRRKVVRQNITETVTFLCKAYQLPVPKIILNYDGLTNTYRVRFRMVKDTGYNLSMLEKEMVHKFLDLYEHTFAEFRCHTYDMLNVEFILEVDMRYISQKAIDNVKVLK
jgi:hypothetical protein